MIGMVSLPLQESPNLEFKTYIKIKRSDNKTDKRRCDLEAKSEDGSTGLILAARLEMNKCVNDLILHHVDVNATDLYGKTALHWACEVNNSKATELLLKNGANKDSQNEREETPLFLAAKEGSKDCVHLLLGHFANRELSDYMDRLPRDIAAQKMHSDIVELLETTSNAHAVSAYHDTSNYMSHQYSKKMAANKKRSRTSAPLGPRGGLAQPHKKKRPNYGLAKACFITLHFKRTKNQKSFQNDFYETI